MNYIIYIYVNMYICIWICIYRRTEDLIIVYQTVFLFWVGLVMFFNSMNLDALAILVFESNEIWNVTSRSEA